MRVISEEDLREVMLRDLESELHACQCDGYDPKLMAGSLRLYASHWENFFDHLGEVWAQSGGEAQEVDADTGNAKPESEEGQQPATRTRLSNLKTRHNYGGVGY